MTPGQIAVMVAAAAGGGVMNALAGGGTLLTFPVLVLLGEPSIQANATSTVALLPGAAASMVGYRREVATHREWLKTLFIPSLAGGAVGSMLLLRTPEKAFAHLAPFLVLFATLLFLLQAVLAGRFGPTLPRPRDASGMLVLMMCLQFGVAVYGGYFGAGMGILMLVILGFLGVRDIHAANGLKNFFGMCINGVAAGYFIFRGVVNWPAALVMILGATIGGYTGARLGRHIGKEKARAAVVVIGFAITGILLWQSR
ncbi:MAG TPA: sulfite exporter TauE/SafE family protein [Patescibacteria group bacterium]|nr:sulfite exporter TauE/SafE family protein [Patescibacteria group bacterium]